MKSFSSQLASFHEAAEIVTIYGETTVPSPVTFVAASPRPRIPVESPNMIREEFLIYDSTVFLIGYPRKVWKAPLVEEAAFRDSRSTRQRAYTLFAVITCCSTTEV